MLPEIEGRMSKLTHNSWEAMRRRCRDKNLSGYPDYGGRGIKVCARWDKPRAGFRNFLDDMGERPSPEHSIDRVDNDGDYEPGNCRWATIAEQSLNRRNNRRVTIGDETLCSLEWAQRYGMKLTTIHGRMRRGETFEQALKRPAGPARISRMLTVGDVTLSLAEWCRRLGIDEGTVGTRLKAGRSVQEALFDPISTLRKRKCG
jgi:hypothetical protein